MSPYRPPQKPKGLSKLGMVPLTFPKPLTEGAKLSIQKYAAHLGQPVPQTEEEFAAIHPLTKFRAIVWDQTGREDLGDVVLDKLAQCGVAVMAILRPGEEGSPIIAP